MNNFFKLFLLFSLLLISCTKYSECNDIMGVCNDVDEPYCHFGFKFESENKNQTLITYSFYSSNHLTSTHAEDDLPTLDFSAIIPCAKKEIKNALNAYEGISPLKFVKLNDNQNADLNFFVADMGQKRGAVAFPNFQSSPCEDISGNIIINSQVSGHNCKSFYSVMLHEIGHALGLGHVKSRNIMNSSINHLFQKLQSGDSLGIIELYGSKISEKI